MSSYWAVNVYEPLVPRARQAYDRIRDPFTRFSSFFQMSGLV
jgi:hypothetical protein